MAQETTCLSIPQCPKHFPQLIVAGTSLLTKTDFQSEHYSVSKTRLVLRLYDHKNISVLQLYSKVMHGTKKQLVSL